MIRVLKDVQYNYGMFSEINETHLLEPIYEDS